MQDGWHHLVIHPENPSDERRREENDGYNRKDFNNLVLFEVNQTCKRILKILQTLKIKCSVLGQ